MEKQKKEQLEKKIAALKEQYKDMEFPVFNSETAWEIGSRIREKAAARGYRIAASVTLNRERLFYMAMTGTSPVNEHWIHRKENTVYTFYKSSYEMALYMQLTEDNIGSRYGLDNTQYVAAGGGVPVIVKGTGVVGTITVSGLSEEEDHNLVTETIQEYLKSL